jgi:hypothetical protein
VKDVLLVAALMIKQPIGKARKAPIVALIKKRTSPLNTI